MNSLRARLFAFLMALAALSALAVGGATYVSVRAEADALFDYHLRQMALSLRDQGRIAEGERAALANPDLDYAVQVWSLDGVALYSNRPPGRGQVLPPRAVLGFSEVQLDGAPWRIYGAATPLRVVQVGQPLAVRRGLAASAAGRSVLPIVAAAPLVAVGLWWLVGISLAPLGRVAAAARARDAGSLEPLPTAGLPSELAPMVGAFNGLLARLSAAFEAQRSFVADAAHEMRTPLTALKLQLSLLEGSPPTQDRTVAVDRLRTGVNRAAHLVTQLLDLARADPGRPPPTAPVDLAAVAREAATDAAPLAHERGASVTVEAPAALALRGDAGALRSLVRNLLDNAIKHGGAAPEVRLTLSAAAEGATLTVDDSGPGIPAADREHVFQRFQRRDDDGGDGSGLGLAIVRAVARQHGAQVTLGDSPAGGLQVRVAWPRGALGHRPPAQP